MKTKEKKKEKLDVKGIGTEFKLSAPQAKSVFLSGDFNQWSTSSHPLKMERDGVWKISLSLNPGQHQYRFLVDGEWQNDPGNPECINNPFGSSNCLKIVG